MEFWCSPSSTSSIATAASSGEAVARCLAVRRSSPLTVPSCRAYSACGMSSEIETWLPLANHSRIGRYSEVASSSPSAVGGAAADLPRPRLGLYASGKRSANIALTPRPSSARATFIAPSCSPSSTSSTLPLTAETACCRSQTRVHTFFSPVSRPRRSAFETRFSISAIGSRAETPEF